MSNIRHLYDKAFPDVCSTGFRHDPEILKECAPVLFPGEQIPAACGEIHILTKLIFMKSCTESVYPCEIFNDPARLYRKDNAVYRRKSRSRKPEASIASILFIE